MDGRAHKRPRHEAGAHGEGFAEGGHRGGRGGAFQQHGGGRFGAFRGRGGRFGGGGMAAAAAQPMMAPAAAAGMAGPMGMAAVPGVMHGMPLRPPMMAPMAMMQPGMMAPPMAAAVPGVPGARPGMPPAMMQPQAGPPGSFAGPGGARPPFFPAQPPPVQQQQPPQQPPPPPKFERRRESQAALLRRQVAGVELSPGLARGELYGKYQAISQSGPPEGRPGGAAGAARSFATAVGPLRRVYLHEALSAAQDVLVLPSQPEGYDARAALEASMRLYSERPAPGGGELVQSTYGSFVVPAELAQLLGEQRT